MTIDLLGNSIISNGLGENILRIVEFNLIKTIKILGGYKSPVCCVTISKDERFLATGDETDRIRIWDRNESSIAIDVKGHVRKIHRIQFTTDDKNLSPAEKITLQEFEP
jgi:WD40 repeat protein